MYGLPALAGLGHPRLIAALFLCASALNLEVNADSLVVPAIGRAGLCNAMSLSSKFSKS